MLAIECPNLFRSARLEDFLLRDAFPGGGPHVRYVQVLGAVVVIVEPADAHAGPDVFDSGLWSDVGEGPVAIVAIQVLPAKVVHDV